MKLEDYRYDNLGTVILAFNNSPKIHFYMTYNNYVKEAYKMTCDDLVYLENSTNHVNNGRQALSAITMGFLAIESYINVVLKIVAHKKKLDFKKFSTSDVEKRLTILLDSLEFHSIDIKKTGLLSRLNEFRQFRNEIFHDRNTGQELKFYKTIFSKIPTRANQIDVFQSLLLCLEVFCTLRYAINGIDLMPNIPIVAPNNGFGFAKLDVFYNNVLKKSFQDILTKHSLKTDLNLELAITERFVSPVFFKDEIITLIKAKQDVAYNYNPNKISTTIFKHYHHIEVERYKLKPNEFRIPNFDCNEI